jgi:flagellar FliL protein
MAKTAPAEKAPKDKKKLLLVGVIALLLVTLLLGAALFLLVGGKHSGDDAEEEEEVVQEEKPRRKRAAPTITSKLGIYTVNLKASPVPGEDEGPSPSLSGMYLQVEISLELEDQAADTLIKNKTAQINNSINLLLSDKTSAALAQRKGKEDLAKEICDEINAIIVPHANGKAPDGPVVSVLFDKFIIQ